MPRISRSTKQKQLLDDLCKKQHSFFSADELYGQAIKHDNSVGLATVYRFLKEQREMGTIFFYQCDGKLIYSNQKKSHCHFVCERTGKTIHFDVDSIDFLKNKIPGKITSFQIEVKGVCEDCL